MENVVNLRPNPDNFGAFWKHCPRPVGKVVAQLKFEQITNGGMQTHTMDPDSGGRIPLFLKETPERLILAMKRYSASCDHDKTERRYILHPATWLNKGRFMDYLDWPNDKE